jgi:hypothetical protein
VTSRGRDGLPALDERSHVRPTGCGERASEPTAPGTAARVKAVFIIYAVLIASGLAYFMALGVLNR